MNSAVAASVRDCTLRLCFLRGTQRIPSAGLREILNLHHNSKPKNHDPQVVKINIAVFLQEQTPPKSNIVKYVPDLNYNSRGWNGVCSFTGAKDVAHADKGLSNRHAIHPAHAAKETIRSFCVEVTYGLNGMASRSMQSAKTMTSKTSQQVHARSGPFLNRAMRINAPPDVAR